MCYLCLDNIFICINTQNVLCFSSLSAPATGFSTQQRVRAQLSATLLKARSSVKISVTDSAGIEHQFEADVVYVCRPPVDVALLRIRNWRSLPDNVVPIEPTVAAHSTAGTKDSSSVNSKTEPEFLAWENSLLTPPPVLCAGGPVVVLGHKVFLPSMPQPPEPSVTRGVISKCVQHPHPHLPQQLDVSLASSSTIGQPTKSAEPLQRLCLIQTTAVVLSGDSGGMLLGYSPCPMTYPPHESGLHLLGMVTSNARHEQLGLFPTLNFSIPISELLPFFWYARMEAVGQGSIQFHFTCL